MQTYIEDGIGLKYVKHRNMQDSVKDCWINTINVLKK